MFLALTTGAAHAEPLADFAWHHRIGAEEPMAGRIVRVDDQTIVTADALIDAAADADWLLIGERHDNRDHHRLQAITLEAVEAAKPAGRVVAFEMIDGDMQEDIDTYLETGSADAAGLRSATRWDQGGWPDWPYYEPVFEAALGGGGRIVAADLTPDQIQAIFEEGMETLPAELRASTGLDAGLPGLLETALDEEIEASHCGMVPGDQLAPMADVQRARDAMLAFRLAGGAAAGRGVLIAGNGHVRQDRGVPWYLRKLRPDDSIVTIGLIELDAAIETELPKMPFDYVWLTPRVDDVDPCEAFRKPLDATQDGE